MIYQYNKIRNKINTILTKINNNGVKIFVQSEFDNSNLYVRGDYKILIEIEKQINKFFPICKTDFVHGCYVPFADGTLQCQHRTEDTISDAWCVTDPCPSPKVLEIWIPKKEPKQIIQEIFETHTEGE